MSNLRSEFLNVSQLQAVSFQQNAWNRLVLDEEYKDVLETIVSSHVDKVAGMGGPAGGKGLSILLHGEPGVGKTLTAGTYLGVRLRRSMLTKPVRVHSGTRWKTLVPCRLQRYWNFLAEI